MEMKATIQGNQIMITDGHESIHLDMDELHQRVHLWITVPNGGQSLMILKFTDYAGIQVKK